MINEINSIENPILPMIYFSSQAIVKNLTQKISAKSLRTLAMLFRLNNIPLPFKAKLVNGRYSRSTHVKLTSDNIHGCIRVTQHFFKR